MRSALALKATRLSAAAVIASSKPGAVGQAAERIVVMHHGLAVGADLQVALDAVAAVDARRGMPTAVFSITPDAASCRPRWAIGRAVSQSRMVAFRRADQDTSNAASTSTAASSGSAATPTVVRAWRPLSPNAATIRSEAPFITLGPSAKPGAELMKPPSRTTRAILSRSPSAGLELRQQIDRAGARRLLAVLDRDAAAELALGDELARRRRGRAVRTPP